MRTVENPKELFRPIDATDIDGETYEFSVDRAVLDEYVGDTIEPSQDAIEKIHVHFQDLSTEELEYDAALETIRTHAIEVDDSDDVPESVDAKFVVEEDGDPVVYMCDTTRMGYEVISQEKPKEGAYACIFPDKIVKIVPSQ